MASYNEVRGNLQNYEVYDETDGSERMLGTASIDLPEFEYMSSDIKGAGILGEVSFPTVAHTNNVTTTLHWRTLTGDLTKLTAPRAHKVTLRGAIQNYDAGSMLMKVSAVKITFVGLPSKTSFGKFKPAEQTESENEFSLLYLKITVDGEELIEYDKINYIFSVNGEDYLADTRAAVGQE